MSKLIIYILLFFCGYKMLKYLMTPSASSDSKTDSKSDAADKLSDNLMIKDPVCEVYFPKKEGIFLNYGGQEMYFCSTECRDKFIKQNSNKS
ncbi:MAG: YHS domain-containing protein [Proteobacteria bacterium]|nr:YHS domain-containing protein [Pseudomonadota bacterium]